MTATIMGLFVVAGLVIFVFMKKRIRNSGAVSRPGFSQYRPLRDMEAENDTENLPVDKDLVDAARTYRKEHGYDDQGRQEVL